MLRSGGRVLCAVLGVVAALEGTARADEPSAAGEAPPVTAQVDLTKDTKPAAGDDLARIEAPPAPPYKNTLVIDASLGAIGFLGRFARVAPPGPWMHVQVGYEPLKWLMLFGEGELAFTDTSNKQPQPATRAFSLFGFGGGARFTVRFTERLGAYVQGSIGAVKAHIATNALGILGFKDAESLDVYFGARLGVEWFMVDRHLALGLNAGPRLMQGFAQNSASTDTPAAIDGGASIRYAF